MPCDDPATRRCCLTAPAPAAPWRAGPGDDFRNIGTYDVNARVRPDKVFCAPPGIYGRRSDGRTGTVRFGSTTRSSASSRSWLPPGDVIELRMPGGAGFGDPRSRDPKAIERDDAATGIVTDEGARADYGYTELKGAHEGRRCHDDNRSPATSADADDAVRQR